MQFKAAVVRAADTLNKIVFDAERCGWQGVYHPTIRFEYHSKAFLKLNPASRDKADSLAWAFFIAIKRLAICHGEGCRRFFIKAYSMDRFCSTRCKKTTRQANKDAWDKTPRGKAAQKRKVAALRRKRARLRRAVSTTSKAAYCARARADVKMVWQF